MAIKLVIQRNTKQIVVPLRVDRAVRGAPVLDAPDVDDRAFNPHLPSGVNKDDARGAVFGMMLGDTVRIRVTRDDIDATAPLFVVAGTSANPQFKVVDLAGGGPLAADGEFKLKAIADNLTPQKLEVRLGSKTGPVLCEASPHIFSPFTFNITPHIVTLHAAASAPGLGHEPTADGTDVSDVLDAIFDIVKAVWRPAGVKLNIGAVREHEVFGCLRDNRASTGPATEKGSEGHIAGLGHKPGTCNLYFLHEMTNKLGRGISPDTFVAKGFSHPAIMIATAVQGGATPAQDVSRSSTGPQMLQELGNDVAHEMGHFVTLAHADNVHGIGPSDTYNRRHLMHANNLLAPTGTIVDTVPVRFDDIGYGTTGTRGHRGCLLTLKQHPQHNTNPDVLNARKRLKDVAKLYGPP